MKRVLLIEDLSSFGKCSMAVAMPALVMGGIEVTFLPTAIFSTHTGISKEAVAVDFSEKMEEFLRHWESLSLTFDAILVGYSYGERQLEEISGFLNKIKNEKAPFLLIDPAMADHGRMYGKLPKNYGELMKDFVRMGDVMTPNLTEAMLLADRDYSILPETREEILEILEILHQKYQEDVVITGVKLKDGMYVFGKSNQEIVEYRTECFEKSYSGTGDLFAAIFLVGMLRKKGFEIALQEAGRLTSLAVKNSILQGMDTLYFESVLKEI